MNSFVHYLSERKPTLKIHTVEGYFNGPGSDEMIFREILQALRQYPDTVACYALTSHDNLPMVQAVREAGMEHQVSVVGTDLNGITTCLLKERRRKRCQSGGLHERLYWSEYFGDRMVKNIEPPLRIDCPIDVVLHSNLSFF